MQPDLISKPYGWIDLPGVTPAGRFFKSEWQQIMRIGRICAWLLSLALLAACTTAPLPDCAAQSDITEYRQRLSQAAREIPYGQGLLWRVEWTDAPPSYVFGTVHSKDPRITRLAQPVAAAFQTARSLTVEIVDTPESESAVARAVMIPGGNVERLVGPERFRRIGAAGARYGLHREALRALKPWALYLLFAQPPAEMRDSRPALDFALQEWAQERGMPVYGLESVEEQLALFDDLEPSFQIALLDEVLAENWRVDCWSETLKDIYLAREIGFYLLLTEQMSAVGDPADRSRIHDLLGALIEQRNSRMVERMTQRLAAGGAFVAVGALHLPGERGILNLLGERGYRISRAH